MELNNIPADYRICSKRLHADCVKILYKMKVFNLTEKTIDKIVQLTLKQNRLADKDLSKFSKTDEKTKKY